MKYMLSIVYLLVVCLTAVNFADAQDPATEPAEVNKTANGGNGDSTDAGDGEVAEEAEDVVSETREEVEEIADKVDKSEEAQAARTEILKPIYLFAEYLSFPAFHWIAFTVMVTGVVSFALQLVLAKLVVLSKLSFSLTEVFADALGLVISLVGLVLTTQAATENSTFTDSPAAVLSATAVGVIVGFIFYLWGQSQEVRAAEGGKRKS